MIVGWGTIFYAFGVLAPAIIADTGMSRGFVYGCFSAAMVASGLLAPSAGKLIDRIGGRRVMTLGSLVATAGFVILGWSPNPAVYALGWVIVGCSIPLTLYDPAFATVTEVGGARRARTMIVLITLFGGFASTLFWPLTQMLNDQIGWRDTWLVYAAANLLLCAPLHHFGLPRHLVRDGAVIEEASLPPAEAPLVSPAQRSLALSLLAVLFASNNFLLSGLSAHLIPVLTELGLTPTDAVALGAVIGPAQVAGRLIELSIGKKISPITIGLIATFGLTLALAIATAIGVHSPWGMAFVIGYGCANGLVTTARGTLPLVLFGRIGYGSILGRLARPSLAAAALAPFLYALAIDVWKSDAALALSIASAGISCLAMAVIALRIGRSARR